MKETRSQVKTVRLLRLIALLATDPTGWPTAVNKRFNRAANMAAYPIDPVCVRTTTRDLATLRADITRHFHGNGELRIVRTVRDYNACDRMQAKLVRILRMIAMLAGEDEPQTLQAINQQLDAVTGTAWCTRTIRRDLVVLKTMGLVTESAGRFTLSKNSDVGARLRIVAKELFSEAKS